MPQFEYARLIVVYDRESSRMIVAEWLPTGSSKRDALQLMIRLNELGAEGWEMISHTEGDVREVFYLKRELPG